MIINRHYASEILQKLIRRDISNFLTPEEKLAINALIDFNLVIDSRLNEIKRALEGIR